jgi:hypothetical protein
VVLHPTARLFEFGGNLGESTSFEKEQAQRLTLVLRKRLEGVA